MTEGAEKSIFLNALDQESAEARELYLRSACGDDQALRASVESLLAAHLRPANPLDAPIIGETTNRESNTEFLVATSDEGRTIGPYRLMEQIGEGGFGLVFVAQQEKPVKRTVALKIIKPGTGSKEILARFDAERQAVAMMNHPHIAQIFDAGVTEDARPYFVMELVRGVPITEFCEQHSVSLRQKIELFEDVCGATHHAHQKGVIHRDIKPSNVLVTLHDHKPVVKVIDFGVAKAVGQNLTDQTIYTRFFSMIGTPMYMSPEQAAMSGLDVDIRSDIYSLGVLLYQLLTGTTPFDRERLNSVGYDEVRRIIREEDPPKPSTRVTETRNANSNTVSNRRKMNRPSSLALEPIGRQNELIPSDLDWIVMKALEKDRQRRYESAAAMADDLRRFLRQEPIEARPPTRRYRLAKFARRNRIVLVTGGLVASALVIGTAASTYQASVAIKQRNQKEVALRDAISARNAATNARQEVEQFAERLKSANSLMGNARANEESRQFSSADAAYSTAINLVPNYYLVWVERARLRAKLQLWTEAAEDFSAALELEAPVNRNQWQGAAALFVLTDHMDDYRSMYRRLMTPPASIASSEAESSSDTNTKSLDWNSIRACLIVSVDQTDAERIAKRVESLIKESQQPRPRRPGGFDRSRDRQPNPISDTLGPLFGGGPDRGPGPPESARRARGPGGPPPGGRLPWSVELYIAGWAHVRAGNNEVAIDYLTSAMSDREWPNVGMVHSLMAIAQYQSGLPSEAVKSLKHADEFIDRMIRDLDSTEDLNKPWFDFAEAVLLHREAAELITGKPPEMDPRIGEFQELSRKQLLDQ